MPGAGASIPSYFYSSDPQHPMAACRPPASFPLNRQRPDVTLHASTEARSPVSYQAQEAASDGSLRRARGGLGVSHVPGLFAPGLTRRYPISPTLPGPNTVLSRAQLLASRGSDCLSCPPPRNCGAYAFAPCTRSGPHCILGVGRAIQHNCAPRVVLESGKDL